MASLDVNRPAAQEQLAMLGTQVERRDAADRRRASSRSTSPGARCRRRSCRAIDVLMLDTAGRLHVDQALMDEMKAVADVATPARDPARRRCADRPGRGQRRAELLRAGAADRRRADPHGRRCARRRGAVDARGHRQADQVRRHRREARRARGVPPRARRRPHPRHGRRRRRWSSAPPRSIQAEEAEQMAAQDGQGSVRPERPARASSRRCGGWAASARSRA